jgi:plasmid replication initiation protein
VARTNLRELLLLMKLPFFGLGRPSAEPIRYHGRSGDGVRFLVAEPVDPSKPMAHMDDAGVMVWVASQLTAQHNENPHVGQDNRLTFRPAEIIAFLGQSRGGSQHAKLEAALQRLANTAVTIWLGKTGLYIAQEPLLLSFERPGPRVHGLWSLTVPSWITEEIFRQRMLTINPASLELGGLERCLYRWARAHTGGLIDSHYRIDLASAHAKAGARDTPRKFAFRVSQIAERGPLLGYTLAIERDGRDRILVITWPLSLEDIVP